MKTEPQSSTPLNVLCLEDEHRDAEILQEVLLDAGYQVNMRLVSTEQDFVAGLKEFPMDIILSDYRLPGFDGLAALKLFQQHRPDVPFICVSGTIGEEASVELLKQGATDYILKDRMSRLGFAVRRALEEARVSRERHRAEVELREACQFNQQIINGAHEGIIVYGPDLRYQVWNPFMESLSGLPAGQVLGRLPREVFPFLQETELMRRLEQALAGSIPDPVEFEYNFNGKTGWLRDISAPLSNAGGNNAGVIAIVQEISGRKRIEAEHEKLQSQLTQAQKMESIGRLAGGVAHDFNNMLCAILVNVDLALQMIPAGSPWTEHLEEIKKCAGRSVELTRQLLAFARKQTVMPKALDLNETVGGMLKMLQRLIGEEISLEWLPSRDLWQVRMDPSQIDQILANLCVNARDAIHGPGKITLETRNITLDAMAATGVVAAPGDYVLLTVSDTGSGMDKEVLAHLFEPFFTTKGPGEGTGLGLATVYGIVKQNQGAIGVGSEPGRGTTFRIHLPRYTGRAAAAQSMSGLASAAGGHETILLVEDEPSLLRIGRNCLQKLGYRVLAAGTPGEAMHIAREHSGDIQLLITDVIMPEMNGRELARQLLSLYPNMHRLFMSGYTSDIIAHRGVLSEGIHFIQKPFTLQSFAAKVREAMGHSERMDAL